MEFAVPVVDYYNRPKVYTPGSVTMQDNLPFLNMALGNPTHNHYRSRTNHAHVGAKYNRYPVQGASLAIQTIHGAFAEHLSLELSPELLWYVIVNEVATLVKSNPLMYGDFFQGDPNNPQTVTVRDDSLIYGSDENQWDITIGLFYSEMVARLGEEKVEVFVPRFSTSTPESDIALLIAFMDSASPYYQYRVNTLCGIPQIRLAGTAEDWAQLLFKTMQLQSVFTALDGYFRDLTPILETIAGTASGILPDASFWRSIYKYEDQSGGAEITGWIQAFFAHTHHTGATQLKSTFNWKSTNWQDKSKPNSFPSHITKVPFVWEYLGNKIKMLFTSGVFGAEWDNVYLAPRLGFGVFEV